MLISSVDRVDGRLNSSAITVLFRRAWRSSVGRTLLVTGVSLSLGTLTSGCSRERQSAATSGGAVSQSAAVVSVATGSAVPSSVAEASGNDVSSEEYLEPETLDYVMAMLRLAPPEDQAKVFSPSPDLQQVQACMETAGFEYFLVNETDGDPRFSMDEETYAKTWGFGATAQLLGTYPVQAGGSPREEYVMGLSESERSAYDAAEQECVANAGIDPEQGFRVDQALDDFSSSVASDPRVQAALKAWSDCMGQYGYSYSDRNDMIGSFTTEGPDLQGQFEQEKAVAVANLSCQPAYREVYRTVVMERFGEYQTLLQAPVAASDAVG